MSFSTIVLSIVFGFVVMVIIWFTSLPDRSHVFDESTARDNMDDHFGGTSWRPSLIRGDYDSIPPADSPALITDKYKLGEVTASGVQLVKIDESCGGCGSKLVETDKFCMECGIAVLTTNKTPLKRGKRFPPQKPEPTLTPRLKDNARKTL